jgi:hypothetical protein
MSGGDILHDVNHVHANCTNGDGRFDCHVAECSGVMHNVVWNDATARAAALAGDGMVGTLTVQ